MKEIVCINTYANTNQKSCPRFNLKFFGPTVGGIKYIIKDKRLYMSSTLSPLYILLNILLVIISSMFTKLLFKVHVSTDYRTVDFNTVLYIVVFAFREIRLFISRFRNISTHFLCTLLLLKILQY